MQRSARVCPPGSGQGAGAAQGLWGPNSAGRGQRDLDRSLGVGLPGGMHGHRPGPCPSPDPAAHHLATQPQRGGGTALVSRPGASATSGRVVTPTVGSPSTAPSCSAKPARRGWSRPVALTSSTSGAIGRARTACFDSASDLGVWCRCVSAAAGWLRMFAVNRGTGSLVDHFASRGPGSRLRMGCGSATRQA